LTDQYSYVLDASALLAHLNDEAGADKVEKALIAGAAISAVNLAEVLSKLADVEEDPANTFASLRRQGLFGNRVAVQPFTEEDAVTIARLYPKTRSHGLSLGDRACLALALRLGVPAMTADRAWTRLKAAVTIETIR
jgi:PIN domain nuclease of toxin-antitoxin system